MPRKQNPKVWLYDFPSVKSQGWARVMLTEDGLFAAASDYGNYVYWWGAHGRDDFRKFFLPPDPVYLMNKFSYDHPRVYDNERTLRSVRDTILQYRRTGDLAKEVARTAWAEIEEQYDSLYAKEDFSRWCRESAFADVFTDAYEWYRETFSPQVRAFVERVIPRLEAAIKQQLEEESKR